VAAAAVMKIVVVAVVLADIGQILERPAAKLLLNLNYLSF
jgi:hypothetical protein